MQSAWVEIELFRGDGQKTLVIRRDIAGDQSSYTMNKKRASEAEVLRAVAELKIQVDNLCQFLPQDRVKDFTKKTPVEVLRETERSVGSDAMLDKHSQLEEWQKERRDVRRERSQKQSRLDSLNAQNAEMEREVQRYQQRLALLDRAELLRKKVLWQRYADREEDYKAAQARWQEHKDRVDRLREEIAPRTVKLREIEGDARQCKEDIQRLKREQRDEDGKRLKYQNELTELIEKHDALQAEVDGEAEERQRAEREIEKMRVEIRKLEQRIAELPDASRAKTELKELEQPLRAIVEKTKRCVDQVRDLGRQKEDCDRKYRLAKEAYNKIENDRAIREEKLMQTNRPLMELVRWMRNTSDFKGRCWEPLCLDLAPRTPAVSAMLEKIIPKITLQCIAVENDDDQQRIRKKAQELRVPPSTYMIYTVERPMESMEELNRMYPPPRADVNFAKYGVTGWLADAFDAPVMTRLVLYSNAMHVLRTLYRDDGECQTLSQMQAAIQSGELDCQGCIDQRTATMFKRSRYGDKAVFLLSEPYKVENRFLVAGANQSQKEARLREMEQAHQNMVRVEAEMTAAQAQEADLQREGAELRQRQKDLQSVEKAKKTLQDSIDKRHKMIRDKESVDYEKKLRDLRRRQGDLRRDAQSRMALLIAPVRAVLEKSLELDALVVRLGGLEEQRDALEAQLSSETQSVKDAEKTLQELKNQEEAAKAARLSARAAARQQAPLTEELQEKFRDLPSSLLELEQEIMNVEQQAQAIFAVPEEQIRRFEERKRDAANLAQEVADHDAALEQLSDRMEKTRLKWLEGDAENGVTKGDKMGLKKLVDLIGEQFGQFMAESGCRGEVVLYTGDEAEEGQDYANYAIHIRVSFRPDGPMKTISSEIHSGGERSVATMMYLISLQPLTPAPFRLVDEINQAMDAQNERRIWEQVVRAASKEDTPQYFLVTPKLLPDLTYTEDMVVLVVFNGPANMNQEQWERSLRKMAGNDDDF